MQLIANLVPRDGGLVGCLPLEHDAGGLLVAMPWETTPELCEGQRMDLMLDAEVAAVRTEVVLQQLTPQDDALEARLVYADPDRVRLRMPGAVHEALSWASERYGRPAHLHLQAPDGSWRGELLDLTAETATIRLPAAQTPRAGDAVTLRLDLPDGGEPLTVVGRTEHASPTGTYRHATLRFAGPAAAMPRLEERVQAWLTTRCSRRLDVAV